MVVYIKWNDFNYDIYKIRKLILIFKLDVFLCWVISGVDVMTYYGNIIIYSIYIEWFRYLEIMILYCSVIIWYCVRFFRDNN